MGIWNIGKLRRWLDIETLITPHGDLELQPYPIAIPLSQAHNPSWGFGTQQDLVRE